MSPDELHKYMRTSGKSAFELALEFANKDEWNPNIDEAPRDGTNILCYNGLNYSISQWNDMAWAGMEPRFFPMSNANHWKPIEPPKVLNDTNH